MSEQPSMLRAMGGLVFDEVIIEAWPDGTDRSEVTLRPDVNAGAIVRDPNTGRWRYDETMRRVLLIDQNPEFETDLEAGQQLREFINTTRIREMLQTLLRGRRSPTTN